jgi:diguanylate cyclase (GGDEF)-like protein/PAS domain S-box-containing protein
MRIIAISSVVVLVLVWIGLFDIIRRTEEHALEQAGIHAQYRVRALSSAIQTTINHYDFVLLAAREAALQGKDAFSRQIRFMSENITGADGVRLFYVEGDGYVVSSSSGPVPRSYVGDRDYFQRLSGGASDDPLVIDPPVMARTSSLSERVVPLARGIFRNGKLTGVVLLSIPVSALQKRLERYLGTPSETMSILMPDGQFILRSLDPDGAYGKRVPANRPYLQHPERDIGTFITSETSDSVERMNVWSRLPGGQYVVSGMPVDEILAPAQQMIRWLKFAGGTVSVLILALAGMLVSVLSRAERLATERNASDQRLRGVIDGMREGVIELDGKNRISRVNPAFSTITGYAAADVAGKDLGILSPTHGDARSLGLLIAQWQGDETRRHEGDFDGLRARGGDVRRAFVGRAVLAAGDSGNSDYRLVLLSDVSAERRTDEEIWREANFDPLTGLVNRELMLNRLELMVQHVQLHKCGLAVLFVDLDYFVPINERNGIEVGNRLLYEVARRLRESFHDEDTIAHLNMDQFVILFSDFGAASVAERAAAKVVSMVSDPFTVDAEGSQIEITCSVGIARYPDQGQTAAELLHAAEQAMTRAKDKGRSSWSV